MSIHVIVKSLTFRSSLQSHLTNFITSGQAQPSERKLEKGGRCFRQ